MPDDAPQPTRKSGVVGQTWQSRPCGEKCLLDGVLGLMKIAQQSERRAEREVLKPSRKLDKSAHVAFVGALNKPFQVHLTFPHTPLKCQESGMSFTPVRASGNFCSPIGLNLDAE